MKISIITAVYNGEKTIEDTLQSVTLQSYSNTEHIIIDGGSKDGTLGIIKNYKDKLGAVVSENDEGVYDAMNKGIKLATGEIIGILNSDDVYMDRDVLATVVKEFENKNIDAVWGDLVYVDREDINKVRRYWKSAAYKSGRFQRGWHPPHPTFFVRKEIYEKFGFFRTDMSIAADYELMLRFLEKHQISSSYIPKILVKMRVGGVSNKSVINIIKANLQSFRAFKQNGIKVSPLVILLKPLSKLFQY